jgi:holin-like protein
MDRVDPLLGSPVDLGMRSRDPSTGGARGDDAATSSADARVAAEPASPVRLEPVRPEPVRASGLPAPALGGFALLLACQLAGEMLSRALHLPFPGPVMGIGLVLALLALDWGSPLIGAASDVLLGHLSLLFVPVGVGVITHLDQLAAHGLALVAVLLLSTWVGLAVTALVLRALLRNGVAA